MSLYANYLKERTGTEIVESDKGFATYKFIPEFCYIEDIYVIPEARHLGIARDMGEAIVKIAKEKGYTKLLGTVVPTANGSTYSLQGLLAWGFRLDSVKDNCIYLVKNI